MDSWISGYDPAYFPPLEILANMYEEKEELFIAIEFENVNEINDELIDLLFSTICMTNSHNYDLTKFVSVNSDNKTINYLRSSIMDVGRRILLIYGNKKEKPTDKFPNLEIGLYHVVKAIKKLAEKYSLNLDLSWDV